MDRCVTELQSLRHANAHLQSLLDEAHAHKAKVDQRVSDLENQVSSHAHTAATDERLRELEQQVSYTHIHHIIITCLSQYCDIMLCYKESCAGNTFA